MLSIMVTKNYEGRKYEIVEYDEAWPERFATEAKVIKDIFGQKALEIEHIGSTSVPGLAGKPTIDVLVLVDDVGVADELKDEMAEAGYTALGGYVLPEARLFMKDNNGHRVVNVHVFPAEHSHVKEMLAWRDYLRVHPEVVAEYSQLKFDLASSYPEDYGQYRKYKDAFVKSLMSKVNFL